jgi:hypothetical protein
LKFGLVYSYKSTEKDGIAKYNFWIRANKEELSQNETTIFCNLNIADILRFVAAANLNSFL